MASGPRAAWRARVSVLGAGSAFARTAKCATLQAMRPSWAVEQRRGGAVEAEHRVHACAVELTRDMQGRLALQVGSDLDTTFRSAAKPFQLESAIGLLPAALAAALTPTDLALGSASHHGEREHIEALTRLLHKLARAREHLYCGAHEPLAVESARALRARGHAPDVLHNNCAGKHAFMAAACAAQGYAADYRPAQHPLQQAIRTDLEQRVGRALCSVVDGCGVPCFVLPLSSMARAYAQLAAEVTSAGSTLSRIGQALRAHPRMMSGTDAFDGWLNEHGVIAKVGAQGLLCLAVPEHALGIAIKIESGVDLARPVACSALLGRLLPGLVPALPERFYAVRNVVGDRVGELVAVER
jgi:L-asparaginase II